MCFNEVVNIRNGYSRARYGGEPGQVAGEASAVAPGGPDY
jgi:hypothetical protein